MRELFENALSEISANRRVPGVVAGVVGACFWGISGVFVSVLTTGYQVAPTWLGCVRVLVGGLVFCSICIAFQREQLVGLLLDRRAMIGTALFAALGIALCQVVYIVAIRETNAGTESLINQVQLVFMMVYTCLRDRKTPKSAELVALALALAGVWFIATKGDPSSLVVAATGIVWCLLDSVLSFLHNALPIYALSRYGSLAVNAVGMTLGGIMLLPAAQPWCGLPALDTCGWGAVAGTTVCGAILGYLLAMQGLKEAGPMLGSLLLAFIPIVATLASAVFLGSAITVFDLIGLACIVGMMAVMSLGKR